ncbi:hypothetical protein [Sphingomonas sp. 3-13AW]|jgi:hypothetical protein|uniref:hypothetical protein n=1 Tax=Sphingomonas sp. 3-13AW TaxID=3050450 RepID=UPI003BB720AF
MRIEANTGLTLSQVEWQAVSAALRSASDCGRVPATRAGPVRRIYRAVTGRTGATPSADPKLEAVRAFVCETSRQRRVAERYVPALLDHGFTSPQVAALALLSA